MQRRAALKNLSTAVGGLMTLPAWAAGWTPESVGPTSLLRLNQEELLAEIVEAIIPETNTPGAKSLKVHQFVVRMINDCYGEAAQKNLAQGLKLTDEAAQKAHSKTFANCDGLQRLALLKQMSESSDVTSKQFVSMIKNLTVQGYTNSQYFMVNVQKYVMAPGFYHGCVPVAPASPKGSK
ncbi:MAG: gluconate 2-dehydrogenase subunit 3 family protein [Spirosomaceae bacterium]|nr:gluconate 2-dehydrogenase subunit 3 family protein [Spirosomataceae bacterium]